MDEQRLARAIARIDEANDADPRGHERTYGERMSAALARLVPDASEPLRIAVRAQHLERWRIPRDSYPRDRPGYLRWRSELAKLHAQRAGEILREVGYGDDDIARVAALIQKKRLRTDPESQALEDCACVVFLEHELEAFAKDHDDEKVVEIIRKTWAKMGEAGHREALRLAPSLSARSQELIGRALAGP